MKYDFTTIMERRGKDATALDGIGKGGSAPDAPKPGFDVIPMWVADMNFPTAPSIIEAMRERLNHPAFGYFAPRKEYTDAIIRWQTERNGAVGLDESCIGYENGVLGGVVNALNVFCSKGDKVLLHSPTYIGFTSSLTRNGYNIVHSPLVQDENGVYRMDYDDMERKISENHIHAAVFCSPHNPSGRVWEPWEIEKAMAVFEKYNVMVVSDEIWADVILTGNKHTPTQSVSQYARTHTVALYAITKTFNLAGMVGSYRIVYDDTLKDRIMTESKLSGYNHMNIMSMYALIGAYSNEGEEWLEELRQVLTGNVDFACQYIAEHFEGVSCTKPEGTYMLFADCTEWCRKHGKTLDEVMHAAWDVGVALQDGRPFHGPCHLRLNLALPLTRVQEAFQRLDKYVFNFKN